jgi:hypothetical protein
MIPPEVRDIFVLLVRNSRNGTVRWEPSDPSQSGPDYEDFVANMPNASVNIWRIHPSTPIQATIFNDEGVQVVTVDGDNSADDALLSRILHVAKEQNLRTEHTLESLRQFLKSKSKGKTSEDEE